MHLSVSIGHLAHQHMMFGMASLRIVNSRALRMSMPRCGDVPLCRRRPLGTRKFSNESALESITAAAASGITDGLSKGLQILSPAFDANSPLKPAFEAARHATNTVLKAVDAPIQMAPVDASLAKEHRSHEHDDVKVDERASLSTWHGTTIVANEDIQAYVDAILADPESLVNNPWIPDAVERKIYMLVVKMVLQMIHFACGVLDQRKVFGMTLAMQQSRNTRSEPLRDSGIHLSPEIFDTLVQQVMVPPGEEAIISKSVDRELYRNVIQFALRLVLDIVDSLRISTFGLKISIKVEPHPENALKPQMRSAMDLEAFEKACEPLIQELLADEDINIAFVADHLELRLYQNVMRIIANLMATAVDMSDIELFGIRLDPDVI